MTSLVYDLVVEHCDKFGDAMPHDSLDVLYWSQKTDPGISHKIGHAAFDERGPR